MKSAVIRDQIGFGSFTKHLFIEISGVWGKSNVTLMNVLCTLIILDTSHKDIG